METLFSVVLAMKEDFRLRENIPKEITQFEKQKSDFIIDLGINKIEIHYSTAEPLKVTLVDTRDDTMTDDRILSKLMASSLC